jgi:uncharacterized DUF497 family protein
MGCPGCEWDPRKDLENQRKHRVKFEDACRVFTDPFREVVPDDRGYGEERWIAVGRANSRMLVVVFTDRGDRTRIISARKADRDEEERYYENLGKSERNPGV